MPRGRPVENKYPWGRKSPDERIAELSRQREEWVLRRYRVEELMRQKLAEIDRHIEAIDAEAGVAKGCRDDLLKERAREIAYALYEDGIDMFDELRVARSGEEALRLAQARRGQKPSEQDRGGGNPEARDLTGIPDLIDDELIEDDMVTADDIAGIASVSPNRRNEEGHG